MDVPECLLHLLRKSRLLHLDCNGGLYQMWYYDSNSMQLKHLADNTCLTKDLLADEMTMTTCSDNSRQKFYIPVPWLPVAYLDKVRSVQDGSKCMDARPDSNNNIWMADCGEGNENQGTTHEKNACTKFTGFD